MLTLPIKKKWFDMILNEEKKEEYREIKPYYDTRFLNLWGFPKSEFENVKDLLRVKETENTRMIALRNGYSRDSCYVNVCCSLRIGYGKTEWGATENECYILEFKPFSEFSNKVDWGKDEKPD